jgi:hypothetical protein
MTPARCRDAVHAFFRDGTVLLLVAALFACGGCASGGGRAVPVDAEIQSLAGSAGVAYERGETERAAGLYERALTRARLVDHSGEAARNAYNLALCRMAEGRLDEARGLLAQARAVLPPRGADTARTWVAEAEAAQRQGRLDDVRLLVQHGLDDGADSVTRAQARLMLAALAGGLGDWASVREGLAAARRDLRGGDAPELQARAEGLAALMAQAGGDVAGAAAALELQAGWFRRAGRYREMAAALAAAGEGYRMAGMARQAYPCLMRSAASHKALGRTKDAELSAWAALSIAQTLQDPAWLAAAAALAAEIKGP